MQNYYNFFIPSYVYTKWDILLNFSEKIKATKERFFTTNLSKKKFFL